MRNLLRTVVVSTAVAVAALANQSCGAAGTDPNVAVQCPTGQHALATSCAWDAMVITIGPTQQTITLTPIGGGTPTAQPLVGCFVFSPDPASAHMNQLVTWTNNSPVSVTVVQSSGTPLATIAPGQTSAGLYWSTAGTVGYSLTSCTSGSAKQGQLFITAS